MTTRTMTRLCAALLLAGCTTPETTPATTNDVTPTTQTLRADLRLRAVNAADFQQLLLRANRIEIRADDTVLAIDEEGLFADLADENQAWKLGSFDLPSGAKNLTVELTLDEIAAWESVDDAGQLDVNGTTISFTVPAEYVARNAKAVVVLDTGRSVLDTGDGRRGLVPQYRVLF